MDQNRFKLQVDSISQVVFIKNRKKTILSDMSLSVKTGEFIAIVGCSGAGKTTLMNILSGYNCPTKGHVYLNGIDLFKEEEYFKGKIAYVPQEEILDPSLTLQKSLEYSFLLRMKNSSKNSRKKVICQVLKMMELTHVKNSLIKNLSGGEKKRAFLATEMLSNPELYLLDEPTTGLDANIEKKVMLKLREMANIGKTIVITVHTVSNLYLCDKILFMGKEGKICYFGPFEDSFSYFGVKEFVDIYELLKEDTNTWYRKYKKNQKEPLFIANNTSEKNVKVSFFLQTKTLVQRYISSLKNNKFMFFLLLGQSIFISLLICIAIKQDILLSSLNASIVYIIFTMAAVWLGLFNTIQEIVKEKEMFKKEYNSGLSFSSYIASKLVIFSSLCFYQSITFISIVYFYLNPRPLDTLLISPFVDFIFHFFFINFATSMIGLFISSLVRNTKTTLILAPLYMMIQMLFSGMFIPFTEITKFISYFVIGRWSYEGFGTLGNLTKYGVLEPEENFFVFNRFHIFGIWMFFLGISLIFILLIILVIRKYNLNKEKNYLVLNEQSEKLCKGKIKKKSFIKKNNY